MTAAPTIRASLAIEHDDIRPRAAWALEMLASRRGWRVIISPGERTRGPAAYGIEIGVGCEGSRLSIPFDLTQWQFNRAEPDAARDPLAFTFWWLARVEERLAYEADDSAAFDQHGRFVSSAAASVPSIGRMPVDDLANELFSDLEVHAIWPGSMACAVALTHDIDVPWRWNRQGVRRALRALRQALGAGQLRSAMAVAGAVCAAPFWWIARRDPWCNAASIARLEREYGATSTSYMIAAHHDPHDGSAVSYGRVRRRYADHVRMSGGEVGLHCSYTASEIDDRIISELTSLRGEVGEPVLSHRFHYLRHLPHREWPQLDACGLTSDASLGYADSVGYRSGTCHPYRAWDHQANRALRLVVVPMPLMDATLEERYSGVRPGSREARELIARLVEGLAQHRGGASVLWHNDKLRGVDQRQWIQCYRDLLHACRASSVWLTGTGAIVAAWDSQFPFDG